MGILASQLDARQVIGEPHEGVAGFLVAQKLASLLEVEERKVGRIKLVGNRLVVFSDHGPLAAEILAAGAGPLANRSRGVLMLL